MSVTSYSILPQCLLLLLLKKEPLTLAKSVALPFGVTGSLVLVVGTNQLDGLPISMTGQHI